MEKTRRTVRTTVPLTVAAAALVLSGAGGAVAGGMITGAQIKNGTVTTQDVRDGTLVGADVRPATRDNFSRVNGYEQLVRTVEVAGGASEQATMRCSKGKHVLSGLARWEGSTEAVQVGYLSTSNGIIAYAENPSVTSDFLVLSAICAPQKGFYDEVIGGAP